MVDLKAAFSARSRTARDVILAPMRRGERTVHMAPATGVGFGNFLYLWLHAYLEQQRGRDYRVLAPVAMNPWLEVLPRLRRELVVTEGEVRVRDRRQSWTFDLRARFGVDYTRSEVHAFVQDMIIGTPLLGGPATRPDTTTVNVRRGDYYAKPHFRGTYSFDIREYLEVALSASESGGGEHHVIQVVSDDVRWCHTKLDGLLKARSRKVEYVDQWATPRDHFRLVSTSDRIIGTNSTFSYWSGHVSTVLYGKPSRVVMPRFHARLGEDYRADQLDPQWSIIDDIPGGWDG